MTELGRQNRISELRRLRPVNTFARLSIVLILIGVAVAWLKGGFSTDELLNAQRLRNTRRFVDELRPYPLQGRDWDWSIAASWAKQRLDKTGYRAAAVTLAISIVASVLAFIWGFLLSLPASRTLCTAEPYLPRTAPPSAAVRLVYQMLVGFTRAVLIFIRSIPEYIWAFLLVSTLGPSAWPAILALALHNAGILGKLDAELIENLEPRPLQALRAAGASRTQLTCFGVLPDVFTRLMLFGFYRWETCVREATVLGMLGIVSLGYWIQDARARTHYDDMLLYVLIGSVLVIVGDIVSALARASVRRG